MKERKNGLEKFIGENVWALVNCNIHSINCSQSRVRLIEVTESTYIVNEAPIDCFKKLSDGTHMGYLGDSDNKEKILTERKEYNKDDIALIEPIELLSTEELFNGI